MSTVPFAFLLVACAGGGLTGQFYYEDEDYERAREEFERAAAARPDDLVLSYWLGKTYAELGEYTLMRDTRDRCLAHRLRYAEEIEDLLERYWSVQQAEGSSLMESRLRVDIRVGMLKEIAILFSS
jgi:tetratricopeptide (TPR) repeat protein